MPLTQAQKEDFIARVDAAKKENSKYISDFLIEVLKEAESPNDNEFFDEVIKGFDKSLIEMVIKEEPDLLKIVAKKNNEHAFKELLKSCAAGSIENANIEAFKFAYYETVANPTPKSPNFSELFPCY